MVRTAIAGDAMGLVMGQPQVRVGTLLKWKTMLYVEAVEKLFSGTCL
jgi:hypothetical protein